MSQQILLSPTALGSVEQQLWGGIDEYCSFRLETLSPSLPVSGSADHDGRLKSLMDTALSSFHQAIAADVANVRGIGTAMAATDQQVATKLGG